ncbi:D-alanyl-D-alanine carboxypeptidase family protein [Aureimonas pseudogalii]|uniref:D-alanyl-D-alanine carboxypeptidase n=1 Tax=Aureimonas pseudogalii TaxID=1744844 RepID=A0A7W6EB19_9HYPH|nr:D-alanyl-D-alanine carboxypeptidase family protein [Aureimonas pseudogalii]MBB3998032.1 D-alanyl-D-alanine carboxypeptidase [Aureimonas pseudogalii]
MSLRLTERRAAGRILHRLAVAALALSLTACQSVDLSKGDLLPLSKAPVLALGAEEVAIRTPAAIVLDADTGQVLYNDDADGLRHPASLTKLMTIYLLFEALEDGKVKMDDLFVVSAGAAAKPPSKLGLRPGETIRVRDAMFAMAVKSANDVASVTAENLGGSEEAFARQMTAKARQLGMTRTNFDNPSGLPDPLQITTARDMAILGLQIRRRFPQYVSLFSTPAFDYAGRHYVSTNKLLGKVPGIDGMKTGFIGDSGFNLVASARRGGRGVIVVVIGGISGRARDARVEQLVDTYLGPAV